MERESQDDADPSHAEPRDALRLQVRLFADVETIDQAALPESAGSRIDDAEIRMAELNLRGTLSGGFAHKFQVDLAGGEVRLKDAFLEYGGRRLSVTIGQLKPMNSMTSATTEIFMERAAPKSAFGSGRQIGVGLSHKSDRWTFFVGGFRGAVTGRDADLGRTYSSRVTVVPVARGANLLHLGGNLRHRRREAGDPLFRYRAGSLLHLGDDAVETAAFADEDLLYGIELAANLGSFSLESECMWLRASATAESGEPDRAFDGCYTLGSLLLFGMQRKYETGRFLDIEVPDSVLNGGGGVWQLALRYDDIDLSDRAIAGGRQRAWSVAINWYLSEQLRLAANYSRAETGYGPDGADSDALGLRLGIIW